MFTMSIIIGDLLNKRHSCRRKTIRGKNLNGIAHLDFRFLLTKMNEDQREEIMALEAILPPDEFYFDADNMEGELRISPRLDSEISVRIQGRSVSSHLLLVAKFKF